MRQMDALWGWISAIMHPRNAIATDPPQHPMKYFFLSEGWSIGRVWSTDGLWNDLAWRRSPSIDRMSVSLVEKGEILWLYRAEEEVLMLEVKPMNNTDPSPQAIGQVVLKRLMDANQVIERLDQSHAAFQETSGET